MELLGTVKKISELQTYQSGFQKRELVLLTDEQYPQPINIEFLSDKVPLLENVAINHKVKIGINIRGREWTSPQGEVKYFNSITGWRLEIVTKSNEPIGDKPTPNTEMPKPAQVDAENPFSDEEDDDLPF